MAAPGLTAAFRHELGRDLKLAFRRWGQTANPLMFFAIVTTLFPLSLSPEPSQLRDISAGVLWVAALLSSLLALETLFRSDYEDEPIVCLNGISDFLMKRELPRRHGDSVPPDVEPACREIGVETLHEKLIVFASV